MTFAISWFGCGVLVGIGEPWGCRCVGQTTLLLGAASACPSAFPALPTCTQNPRGQDKGLVRLYAPTECARPGVFRHSPWVS